MPACRRPAHAYCAQGASPTCPVRGHCSHKYGAGQAGWPRCLRDRLSSCASPLALSAPVLAGALGRLWSQRFGLWPAGPSGARKPLCSVQEVWPWSGPVLPAPWGACFGSRRPARRHQAPPASVDIPPGFCHTPDHAEIDSSYFHVYTDVDHWMTTGPLRSDCKPTLATGLRHVLFRRFSTSCHPGINRGLSTA